MKKIFNGIFQPGNCGEETINGIKYIISYPSWVIIILRIVKFIQKKLWLSGIAIHDPIFGECTPDFNCCCNIGRKSFFKISQKDMSFFNKKAATWKNSIK